MHIHHLFVFTLLLSVLFHTSVHAQSSIEQDPEFKAEIFKPGIISLPDRFEFGSVFNEAGTEFYFGIDVEGKTEILFSSVSEGNWSEPEVLVTHPEYSHNDPMLTPDGSRLYFISNRPMPDETEAGDYNIWYIQRNGSDWSEPIAEGLHINTESHEYYISFTSNGDMYFGSNRDASPDRSFNFDIYKSVYHDGQYAPAAAIDTTVNTRMYEADVYVAPEESYLIFSSFRRSGLGEGDLYISFSDENGHWSEARNMGTVINTDGHELCPFVSADGRYLYYTSRQDIYRIDAAIIETLRP